MNTLVDTFKRAAPHWHERLAARAVSLATGMDHSISLSIVQTMIVLLGEEHRETGESIRTRLNPHTANPTRFGIRPSGDTPLRPLDWLREELDL